MCFLIIPVSSSRSSLSARLLLIIFSLKKLFAEELPRLVIHQFEHAAGWLAAILKHLSKRRILERPGRKKLLKSFTPRRKPRLCLFGNAQTLQIRGKVLWADRADPAHRVGIGANHFRVPGQAFINRSHNAVYRCLERSGSLALSNGEQLVASVNLNAQRRQLDSINSAEHLLDEPVQSDVRETRMREMHPRVTRIEKHAFRR